MVVYELREEYKKELKYYENTRQFFYYEGDIGRRTIVKDIEEKTLLKEITEGKTAVFPIYEKQRMNIVDGHKDLGFKIYFMRARAFNSFKAYYIDRCVNIPSKMKESKQGKLF